MRGQTSYLEFYWRVIEWVFPILEVSTCFGWVGMRAGSLNLDGEIKIWENKIKIQSPFWAILPDIRQIAWSIVASSNFQKQIWADIIQRLWMSKITVEPVVKWVELPG